MKVRYKMLALNLMVAKSIYEGDFQAYSVALSGDYCYYEPFLYVFSPNSDPGLFPYLPFFDSESLI